MIEITPHARKRMEERGITIEQVEETVQNPEGTIEVKHGRKASYRRYGSKFVVVIYEEEGENVLVITALKVDERRLRRYGFGGV